MTSVVYVLLRRKPELADDLFAAIFKMTIMNIGDKIKFRTPNRRKYSIDLSSLARGYLRQRVQLGWEARELHARGELVKEQQKVQKRQQMPQYIVDYLLSRALGYLLKKTDAERYNSEKADFNVKFDYRQPKDYRYLTRAGTLALRTRNLAFILKDILGAQNLHITKNSTRGPGPGADRVTRGKKVDGINESWFSTAQELRNKFVTHFPPNDRTRFAIAAIFSDLHKARNFQSRNNINVPGQPPAWTLNRVSVGRAPHDPITNDSTRDARDANLQYNHWVVIEGFDQPGNATNLLIWTWANYYRLNVQNQNLLSYIYDVIFGQFP
jgi:hypothetical protein